MSSRPVLPPHVPWGVRLRGGDAHRDDPGNKQALLSQRRNAERTARHPQYFKKMTNGWTAYEFGFLPSQECQNLAGILIAGSIVFALDDAMWKKYRIGSIMKLAGRNGKIVNSNYSVQPTSKLDLGADPSESLPA
jgi:hypothetical protein